jgi:site-specific recombinase XerD
MPEIAALTPAFEDLSRQFLAFIRIECGLLPNTLAAYRRDLRDLLLDLQSRGIQGQRRSPRETCRITCRA